MSADHVLRFWVKCLFFGQSLSRGHYQSTYQPPDVGHVALEFFDHVTRNNVTSSMVLRLFKLLLFPVFFFIISLLPCIHFRIVKKYVAVNTKNINS